jgi:hypothetical protein
MRIILIILIGFCAFTDTHAQSLELDTATHKYVMQNVIIGDSLSTRKVLYERSKEWIVRNLKSSDNNVNLDDKEYKQLTATGNLKAKNMDFPLCMVNSTINFKMTVDVKDGKIRYTIENIVYYATMNCSTDDSKSQAVTMPVEQIKRKNKFQEKIFDEVELKLKALVNDLTSSIRQEAKKKDDW